MEVILEGQDDLLKALDKFGKDALKEASIGLQKAGMSIVADAQVNLREGGHNSTSRLSNSGNVVVLKDGSVEAGFMQVPEGAQKNYAEYLETGTKPRTKGLPYTLVPGIRKPQVKASILTSWVSKKMGIYPADGLKARSMAFLIARSIKEHGTKAHPYFVPAVKKNEKKVIECLQNALNKAIQKNTR